MKIKEIKQTNFTTYEVTFEPNWLERLFGIKECTKEYKQTSYIYKFGRGSVYVDKSGRELGNGNWIGKAIDRYQNSW